jgi:hypothetical protein
MLAHGVLDSRREEHCIESGTRIQPGEVPVIPYRQYCDPCRARGGLQLLPIILDPSFACLGRANRSSMLN